jgi:hypothetical protein
MEPFLLACRTQAPTNRPGKQNRPGLNRLALDRLMQSFGESHHAFGSGSFAGESQTAWITNEERILERSTRVTEQTFAVPV